MAQEEKKDEVMGMELKAWLKKEDIFDNDLFEILDEQGVKTPGDFASYTQEQWDEFWRRGAVERAKELKDQKAKVRNEKKMTKLEKFWRKTSGLQKTSIKKKKGGDEEKEKPLENSAAEQQDALSKGADLKKWMQKNQCFMIDLLIILVKMEITCEDDIAKIDSNPAFDEVYRKLRVARAKELKANDARIRMEKTMTKFEKLWRAKTGVKKTSIQDSGKKKNKKKDPKTSKNESMAAGGAQLKKWMRKNDVWEMALYDELMANDISDPDQLKDMSEDKFDDIVRKVRVDRFSQLKDQSARNRADKLLIKFEKEWRKASGIKKTSIKKK